MAQRLCPGCSSVLVGGGETTHGQPGPSICPKDAVVTQITNQHVGPQEKARYRK